MSSPDASPPPVALPDLHNYTSYQDWLFRVLDRISRVQGAGALAALANRVECTQGHLQNIATRRRRLRSPLLERLAEALALSDAQARLLALKVTLAHARGEANRVSAQQALDAFELEQGRPRAEPRPGTDGPVLGSILGVLAGSRFWMDPQGLSQVLWPPFTAADIRRVCAVAADGGGYGPARRNLALPGPGEIAWAQDVLRGARLALSTLALGQRLLRFSIWFVPDQGWPEALAILVNRFQTETAIWAEGLRASRGPFQVMGVYLQDTPLSASVTGSGPAWTEGALRGEKDSSIQLPEGVSPPSMVDTSQTHPVSFAFDDSRAFLNAWVAAKRAAVRPGMPAYTLSQLARKVGCRTGTLGNVLTGRRPLPDRYREALIAAMRLLPLEAEDFRLCVRYTESTSVVERGHLLRTRMATPAFQAARPVGAAAMACLSELVHCTVLELARHPQFRPDPDWIASVLTPPCTPAKARKALDDLQLAGALAVNAAGALRPSGDFGWMAGAQNPNLSHALHRENLAHAQDALAQGPARTRIAGQLVLVPVSEQEELLGRVRAFHAEIDALCAEMLRTSEAKCWSVRLLTLQLFQGSAPLHPQL